MLNFKFIRINLVYLFSRILKLLHINEKLVYVISN